jgi:hypothetical protein
MKILKTSSLVIILGLGSLSANAESYSSEYDGSDSFRIDITTAQQIDVSLTYNTLTFENLIPGETISSSLPLQITANSVGNETHNLICQFGIDIGANFPNNQLITELATSLELASAFNLAQTSDSTAIIENVKVAISSCLPGAVNAISISGTVGTGLSANETFSKEIDIIISYGSRKSASIVSGDLS